MRDFLSTRKSLLTGQNYLLHLFLFLLTFFCTTWAGAFWTGHPISWSRKALFFRELSSGIPYSIALLSFLTVHEFAHFFAAIAHRLRASLPYYIPVPPLPFLLSIGTMGAVIRIKERIPNSRGLLDTGAAGPLSGFVIAFGLLLYGFLQLPPSSYIYTIHPEYLMQGGIPDPPQPGTLYLGKNLLYLILEVVIAPKNLPPMTEMYHYPFLFTGWLGCFVTALNLLPVGQLDGGHVVFAMFGRKGHYRIARFFMAGITLLGLPSLLAVIPGPFLPGTDNPLAELLLRWSWPGWLLWSLILMKFIGIDHPPVDEKEPLAAPRLAAGWVCIAVFILTFTPVPFGIV
jgi:membrane-associated protease RseP (regulator of RpoE activity)